MNLLYCTTCGQHYHYTGAQVRITSVIRAGWQCQKCKWCLNCRQSNQDDRYLLCDVCDGAFHAHCLRPQIATIPKNGWKCKVSFKYINKCLVVNINSKIICREFISSIFVFIYSVVGNALIVDLELQDQVNHPDGTPIILSVTRAINKETKGLLVQFVQRLIDIRRRRK